jgi:Protein of unknown function (DUF1091)
MNYCNVRRNLKKAPFFSQIVEFMSRYGNSTAHCPWKLGSYGMWNVPLDDHFLPMKNMIPNGKYLMAISLTDENDGKIEFLVVYNMTIVVA